MDGARAQRAARSGLDRGRFRLRPLAAGVARHRPARCLRVEGSARRPRPCRRHDRRRAARHAGCAARPEPRFASAALAGGCGSVAAASASVRWQPRVALYPTPLPGSGDWQPTVLGRAESAESPTEAEAPTMFDTASHAQPSLEERGTDDMTPAPAVIPLVHAPDDPGPDNGVQPEPAVEPRPSRRPTPGAACARCSSRSGWRHHTRQARTAE